MKEVYEKYYIYEDEKTHIKVIADGKTVTINSPAKGVKPSVPVRLNQVLPDTPKNRKKYIKLAIKLAAECEKKNSSIQQ